MLCADELIDVWSETPGANLWLLDAAPKKESRKVRRH
jgi:hypothetical protein